MDKVKGAEMKGKKGKICTCEDVYDGCIILDRKCPIHGDKARKREAKMTPTKFDRKSGIRQILDDWDADYIDKAQALDLILTLIDNSLSERPMMGKGVIQEIMFEHLGGILSEGRIDNLVDALSSKIPAPEKVDACNGKHHYCQVWDGNPIKPISRCLACGHTKEEIEAPQSDAGAELNGHSRTHYLRWNKGKLEQRWISCYQGVEDLWIEIEDIATVALKKGE